MCHRSGFFKPLLIFLSLCLVLFPAEACGINVIEPRTSEDITSSETAAVTKKTDSDASSPEATSEDTASEGSAETEEAEPPVASESPSPEAAYTEEGSSVPDSTTLPYTDDDASGTETSEEPSSSSEAPAETTTEPAEPAAAGPQVPEGPVKNMLRQGLSWVSRSMGYSMEDRTGANGHFDCSGLVSVLLRDALGENTIGWFGSDPWDTAYWRYFCSQYAGGNRVQIGNTVFEVRFRESYDYSHAWEIPGSIVVQYPPENDPSSKSGHISLALGTIPYESTQDVIRYLQEEYGVELSGMTGNEGNIPMVYDPNGVGSGHVTWKINANGVAKATCVDNNYCNDPAWIERISAVFVPVND